MNGSLRLRNKKLALSYMCRYFVTRVSPAIASGIEIFERAGGVLKMSQAIASGINRRTLYEMHHQGVILRITRGVYRLASLPDMSQPDLVTVATRVPNGVVCLLSALAFHELTTHIPSFVDLAILRGSEKPKIEYPPVQVYWFSQTPFENGIETHETDGVNLRVYSPEKTLADIFKYRNKVGLDLAVEALQTWRTRPKPDFGLLMKYAKICRVDAVMRPYAEALA